MVHADEKRDRFVTIQRHLGLCGQFYLQPKLCKCPGVRVYHGNTRAEKQKHRAVRIFFSFYTTLMKTTGRFSFFYALYSLTYSPRVGSAVWAARVPLSTPGQGSVPAQSPAGIAEQTLQQIAKAQGASEHCRTPESSQHPGSRSLVLCGAPYLGSYELCSPNSPFWSEPGDTK